MGKVKKGNCIQCGKEVQLRFAVEKTELKCPKCYKSNIEDANNLQLVKQFLDTMNENPKLLWEAAYNLDRNPYNFITNKDYTGGRNRLTILIESMLNAWSEAAFCGKGQAWQKGKGKLEKGSVPTLIYYPVFVDEKDKQGNVVFNDNGQSKKKLIRFNFTTVFHYTQFEWLDKEPQLRKKFTETAQALDTRAQKLVDTLFTKTPIVTKKGVVPNFNPRTEQITMPHLEDCKSREQWLSTLFHELIHWTGIELRDLGGNKPKIDDDYAFEELVAELGSAFLCNRLHVEGGPKENHAAYLQHWAKSISTDNKILWKAAGKAEKACNLIMAILEGQTNDKVGSTQV